MDTEFVRERTFWPQLALIQIGIPTANPEAPLTLLVDPLQPGILSEVHQLFLRSDVTAIVHSPSEDWVALRENVGALPARAFDTQQAAAMLGMGSGISYLKLVELTLDVALEKGEQRSDWLRRPLSESQQKYAADDVIYLLRAYDILSAQLAEKGFEAWFEQDMDYVLDHARTDRLDPWPHLTLRGAGLLDMEQQRVLHRLFVWREQRARQNNLPRTWVLGNDAALAIAKAAPATLQQLERAMSGIPKAPFKIARLLLTVATTPVDEETELPDARLYEQRDKNQMRALQATVKRISDDQGFSDGFLASRRWLEQWLDTGHFNGPLAGWRRALLEPAFGALSKDASSADTPT